MTAEANCQTKLLVAFNMRLEEMITQNVIVIDDSSISAQYIHIYMFCASCVCVCVGVCVCVCVCVGGGGGGGGGGALLNTKNIEDTYSAYHYFMRCMYLEWRSLYWNGVHVLV